MLGTPQLAPPALPGAVEPPAPTQPQRSWYFVEVAVAWNKDVEGEEEGCEVGCGVFFPSIRQSCLCSAPQGLAVGLGAPWQSSDGRRNKEALIGAVQSCAAGGWGGATACFLLLFWDSSRSEPWSSAGSHWKLAGATQWVLARVAAVSLALLGGRVENAWVLGQWCWQLPPGLGSGLLEAAADPSASTAPPAPPDGSGVSSGPHSAFAVSAWTDPGADPQRNLPEMEGEG